MKNRGNVSQNCGPYLNDPRPSSTIIVLRVEEHERPRELSDGLIHVQLLL
jgi:hypothetical protein